MTVVLHAPAQPRRHVVTRRDTLRPTCGRIGRELGPPSGPSSVRTVLTISIDTANPTRGRASCGTVHVAFVRAGYGRCAWPGAGVCPHRAISPRGHICGGDANQPRVNKVASITAVAARAATDLLATSWHRFCCGCLPIRPLCLLTYIWILSVSKCVWHHDRRHCKRNGAA